MAKNVEGVMQDALDAAADEAVQEFEAQSEDSEVEFELDPDDEEPADDAEADGPVEFEWDGNPETVPANLRPYYDKTYEVMRKGVDVWMSKKATEWQQQRQAYEQRLKDLEDRAREQQQKAIEPPEPTEPGENATAQDWQKYTRDLARYEAWQIINDREQLNAPANLEYQRQLEYQQEAIRRSNMIESQPGYTDEVGNKMVELAKSNPYWSSLINTDEGLMALFDTVKTQVEAAKHKEAAAKASSAEIQHKANAAKRRVSKPKTAAKKVTPARNFAEMGFEDKIDAAIEDAFRDFGS